MRLITRAWRTAAGLIEQIPGAFSVVVGLLPLACIVYMLFTLVSCTWDHVTHSPAERRVNQLERALKADYQAARASERCFEVEASGRYMPPAEQCSPMTQAERVAAWQRYEATSAELDRAVEALRRERASSP